MTYGVAQWPALARCYQSATFVSSGCENFERERFSVFVFMSLFPPPPSVAKVIVRAIPKQRPHTNIISSRDRCLNSRICHLSYTARAHPYCKQHLTVLTVTPTFLTTPPPLAWSSQQTYQLLTRLVASVKSHDQVFTHLWQVCAQIRIRWTYYIPDYLISHESLPRGVSWDRLFLRLTLSCAETVHCPLFRIYRFHLLWFWSPYWLECHWPAQH